MIPVFVIVRDRFIQLKRTIESLERAEGIDIILLDNASTYEPTTEYLKSSPHEVRYVNDNLGHHSPWTTGAVTTGDFFGVTDPDIVVHADCPANWPAFFVRQLQEHPQFLKCGMSLKIDDIPSSYFLHDGVVAHESQFWRTVHTVSNGIPIFNAPLDTTLAIYRPGASFNIDPALRVGYPYTAHHLAWYVDSNNLTEDEIYYREHANKSVASWRYSEVH